MVKSKGKSKAPAATVTPKVPTSAKGKPRARATGAPSPSSAIKPVFDDLDVAEAEDDDDESWDDEEDDEDDSEDFATADELEALGLEADSDLDSDAEDALEGSDDSSGSDGDGITDSAMRKLISLVDPSDIPEGEMEALAALQEQAEEDDDDDHDDEEDEELADANGEVTLTNGHADEEEMDGIEYEDLPVGSDDEDIGATIKRRVITNDESALERLLESLKPSSALGLDFFETQTLTHDAPLDVPDVHDDISREVELYKVALSAASRAQALFASASKPFFRPADYFAEMVKSDAQMEKIRSHLLDEQAGLKASEEARRQRGLKKFGKAVQVQKRLDREKEAKRVKDGVNELRKKRKGGALSTANADEFDIALDDAIEDARPSKRGRFDGGGRGGRGGGRGGRGDSRMPRTARDAKFGRPRPTGAGRRAKENTRESAGSFAGFGGRGDGKPGGRGRGAGGARRGGKPAGGPTRRPGKSKRTSRG